MFHEPRDGIVQDELLRPTKHGQTQLGPRGDPAELVRDVPPRALASQDVVEVGADNDEARQAAVALPPIVGEHVLFLASLHDFTKVESMRCLMILTSCVGAWRGGVGGEWMGGGGGGEGQRLTRPHNPQRWHGIRMSAIHPSAANPTITHEA